MPLLDDLIEKIGVETDQPKRTAMIQQSIRLLQADLPT